MKAIALVSILTIVLGLTSLSRSADWVAVGATIYDYKEFVFVDLSSVNCLGNGKAQLWFKFIAVNYNYDLESRYKAIQRDMNRVSQQQMKELYELCDLQKTGYYAANVIVDSKNYMFKGVIRFDYDGYGKPIKQTSGSNWLPIPPEGVFRTSLGVIGALCKE
jgi:hypothetical protein